MSELSLWNLCLNSIRNDSKIIKIILKRNKNSYPISIRLKIYKYILNKCKYLNNKDVGFFVYDIIELNEFTIDNKFLYITNLNFLNNQPIRNLYLNNLYKIPIIPNLPLLENIEIKNCKFIENFGCHVCQLLKKSSNLKSIVISSCLRTHKGLSDLLEVLSTSTLYLKKFTLESCRVNNKECIHIGNLLKHCDTLKSLQFENNFEINEEFQYLCFGLESSPSKITILSLSMCFLNETQSKMLGLSLNKCCYLEQVNFSLNWLSGAEFKTICKGLRSSRKSLKILDFEKCQLSTIQIKEFIKLLKKCKNLEEVNLGENKNVSENIESIFHGLLPSKLTLKSLNLNYFSMPDRIILSIQNGKKNFPLMN